MSMKNGFLSRRRFLKVAGAAGLAVAGWAGQIFPEFALANSGRAGQAPVPRVPGAADVPPWTWGTVTSKTEMQGAHRDAALAVHRERGSAHAAAAAAGFQLEGTHVGTARYTLADGHQVLASAWLSGDRVLASYDYETPRADGYQGQAMIYEISSDLKGSLLAAAVNGKLLKRGRFGATASAAETLVPIGAAAVDAEAGWCSICCNIDFTCIMGCCDYCFWPCLAGPQACIACALWWCSMTCPLSICCRCFCDCGNAWGCRCCA
jgi:hypothetical protein